LADAALGKVVAAAVFALVGDAEGRLEMVLVVGISVVAAEADVEGLGVERTRQAMAREEPMLPTLLAKRSLGQG
jgi:hypothetical protein